MRSQSGSVAMTRSAFVFRPRSIPMRQGFGVFGFGDFTVGKTSVELILLRRRPGKETEPIEHRLDDHATGPMKRCEDNAQDLADRDQVADRAPGLEPSPCRLGPLRGPIVVMSPGRSCAPVGSLPVGVYLRDDPAGVRLDDLRAVVKVNFVTVIVRRIVAGGDDDSGVRLEITDGE